MKTQTILIGLDGAPWSLVKDWLDSGRLPNIEKIARSGIMGKLLSTIPSNTSPAVPALVTGMNPGNLGMFTFVKPDGSPLTSLDINYNKVWNILDKNGYKSFIVSVPLSYPPDTVNGVMISDWTPGGDAIYTYPDDVQKKLDNFHDPKVRDELYEIRNYKNIKEKREELVRKVIDLVNYRYGIYKKLYSEDTYDFSMLYIYQTDFLQHCLWEYKEDIYKLYQNIDKIFEDILSTYPDRNIIIVSDHGFEANPKQFFMVNTWLKNEGYIKQQPGIINILLNEAQFFGYNYLPRGFLSKVFAIWQTMKLDKSAKESHGDRVSVERLDTLPGIDYANSAAYLSTQFGIKVNAGEKYDSTRNELIDKLEKLVDKDGDKIFKKIYKKEEVYKGKYMSEIPDIIITASEKYVPFPTLTGELYKKVNRRGLWWQSGEHARAREGILIASGPSIKNVRSEVEAHIEDITPTVLHIIGASIPSYIDGAPFVQFLNLERNPVYSDEPTFNIHKHEALRERGVDKEEEKLMLERLRKLGYIE
jgi:predicted AlkP superfamily phosphohydrolase/phosphomutase